MKTRPENERTAYAMLYRPPTQFGTLPPSVHVVGWKRVPPELGQRFPDITPRSLCARSIGLGLSRPCG